MIFGQTTRIVDLGSLRRNFERHLRAHKGKYIFQGTMFIVSGVLAAALPGATALSAELLIGIVLLFSGILQLVMTMRSHMHWWSLLSSLLSILVGAIMLWKPFEVLLAFVTLLAVFMTLEGLLELLLAFQFRPARNWGWMLFSGMVTLTLAAVLWIGFPAFPVLYLGWVIAVNFILYGLSLIMLVWRVAS